MFPDPSNISDGHAPIRIDAVASGQAMAELRVTGSIDQQSAHQLAIALKHHRDDGRRWVLLDLSEVTFVSAVGVEILLREHQRFRDGGGALALTGTGLAAPSPDVHSPGQAPLDRPAPGLPPDQAGYATQVVEVAASHRPGSPGRKCLSTAEAHRQ